MLNRRAILAGMTLPLWGCQSEQHIDGEFVAQNAERAHSLIELQKKSYAESDITNRSTEVLIVGAGVAGLSAGRALLRRKKDEFVIVELDDQVGGNSKGSKIDELRCPWGAHYLPVPSDRAMEVQDFLEEIGIRKREAGRWVIDEKHLCHSPQERLFIDKHWQEGLLPIEGVSKKTKDIYLKFKKIIDNEIKSSEWQIPIRQSIDNQPRLRYLSSIKFSDYLNNQGIDDKNLIWYLNYCCLDEYGADINKVSAWAGLHYFASRHGFYVPGTNENLGEGVLTWPEGNAWLIDKLYKPLRERVKTGQLIFSIEQNKHAATALIFDNNERKIYRWKAQKIIIAVPIFVASKIVKNSNLPLHSISSKLDYAPWLVANIYLKKRLQDNFGAAPSWDNVVFGKQSLGYVDATHQLLSHHGESAIITYYKALGGAMNIKEQRNKLLKQPWIYWKDQIISDFLECHPDLAEKTKKIDFIRYGHGMAIPTPKKTGKIVYSWQERLDGRIAYAHSDWSGYSIFEEAFTLGYQAGNNV